MSKSTGCLFEIVNDLHSRLNPTRVRVHRPTSVLEIARLIRAASETRSNIAVCGGRHAMGGQQFVEEGDLLDLRMMNRVLEIDMERGWIRVEGGIQWPALIQGILDAQCRQKPDCSPRWGIAQKQTGADMMTLGGALAANIHGRGLLMGPIAADVEALTLVTPSGEAVMCNRNENSELFSLAIGGYGLFGVIADVTLRLAPRRTLRRVVRVIDLEEAVHAADRRIREGALYGDFQFDIDPHSPDFLTKGVFSSYSPVEGDPEPPAGQRQLSREDWLHLLSLAHTDKKKAFTMYAQHYLATDGQLYKSDTHQLSEYVDDYHSDVERRISATCRGSEIISELYVPPEQLIEFMHAAAKLLIEQGSQVIYGTIRLIQPDPDTFMAWAQKRYACVVFNIHVDHVAASIERASCSFRGLIDVATNLGGSFYLTYHRFASPQQLERCYPSVRAFFAAKRRIDPAELFQSDWYRHYSPHFGGVA